MHPSSAMKLRSATYYDTLERWKRRRSTEANFVEPDATEGRSAARKSEHSFRSASREPTRPNKKPSPPKTSRTMRGGNIQGFSMRVRTRVTIDVAKVLFGIAAVMLALDSCGLHG